MLGSPKVLCGSAHAFLLTDEPLPPDDCARRGNVFSSNELDALGNDRVMCMTDTYEFVRGHALPTGLLCCDVRPCWLGLCATQTLS